MGMVTGGGIGGGGEMSMLLMLCVVSFFNVGSLVEFMLCEFLTGELVKLMLLAAVQEASMVFVVLCRVTGASGATISGAGGGFFVMVAPKLLLLITGGGFIMLLVFVIVVMLLLVVMSLLNLGGCGFLPLARHFSQSGHHFDVNQ